MDKQLETDIRFLRIAKEVGLSSKCLSRKVGAIIVQNGSIVSEGRNGPPRRVKHCNERPSKFYLCLDKNEPYTTIENEIVLYFKQCPRKSLGYKSGEGLHLCLAQHGEENAINQAAMNGVSTKDGTLYAYVGQVCKSCAGSIINAGIKRLVYLQGPVYDNYTETILKESGITVVTIDKELVDAVQ